MWFTIFEGWWVASGHRVHQVKFKIGSFECPFCNYNFNLILKLREHIKIKLVVHNNIVIQVFESTDGKYFYFQTNYYLKNGKQSKLLKRNQTD